MAALECSVYHQAVQKRTVPNRRGGAATRHALPTRDRRLLSISYDARGLVAGAMVLLGGFSPVEAVVAAEETRQYLRPCSASDYSCVSTSAISAPSKYLPPWSYEGSLTKAKKQLEDAIVAKGGKIAGRNDTYLRAELPYPGTFMSRSGVDTVEFLFSGNNTVTFRSVDSVARAPTPFCLKPGCVNGAPNRQRLEALRDELDWSPLETDEDKKWMQIMLH